MAEANRVKNVRIMGLTRTPVVRESSRGERRLMQKNTKRVFCFAASNNVRRERTRGLLDYSFVTVSSRFKSTRATATIGEIASFREV